MIVSLCTNLTLNLFFDPLIEHIALKINLIMSTCKSINSFKTKNSFKITNVNSFKNGVTLKIKKISRKRISIKIGHNIIADVS